jgi:c-di-GMP-binding flagellar brake protein YcgR
MARVQGKDQRRHVRYELVDFAMLEATSLEEPIRCVVVDVSLGGIQVRSKIALPIGERCILHIAQLGAKALRVRGEVRHTEAIPGMDLIGSGFRFLPETHEDRIAIMEYVHSVFLRRSELMAG